MREIKLKVWDSKKKRFLEGGEIIYKMYPGEEGFTIHTNELEYVYDNGYYEQHRFTVIEYTGLKDKEGVEIYEGDYLIDTDVNQSGIVFYDQMKAGFYISTLHGYKYYIAGKNGGFRGTFINAPRKTVKSNIYENPNLLTK